MTRRRNSRNLLRLLLITLLAVGLSEGLSRAAAAPEEGQSGTPAAEPKATDGEAVPIAETAEGDTCRPTTAALLVRGVRMFERQEMRAGLEVLARVVEERPAWEPALIVRAGALLRSGRFDEAADGFAALLGRERARALGRGDLAARNVGPDVDPELVFGLAIANHYLGSHRVADRLYRTYADLTGPTSERAARAYWRLSEMFSEVDVSWGDAPAERTKALAVDPSIVTKLTLPDLPDLRSIEEAEPYTRSIVLAPDRPAPQAALESLPVLVDWTEPAFSDTGAVVELKREAIEILVAETGRPEEVALPSELDLGSGPGASLAEAVMDWCFEPALGESGALAAWITLEVDVPVPAPPDTVAEAASEPADTLGAPEAGVSERSVPDSTGAAGENGPTGGEW